VEVEDGKEVRYLGAYLTWYGGTIRKEWWMDWMRKRKEELERWKWITRGIGRRSRVRVINGWWLPKLWWIAKFHEVPQWVRKKLEQWSLNFVWKVEKGGGRVAGDRVMRPLVEGGLELRKIDEELRLR